MPEIKKRKTVKGFGPPIVTESVRSHANDPFFVKKNAEAKETLSKIDLSILKKK